MITKYSGFAKVSLVTVREHFIRPYNLHFGLHNAAGGDFQPLNGTTRTFPPGSSTGHIQCVNVTIVKDDIPEENEMFSVELSSSDTSVELNRSFTVVIIINDDSKYPLGKWQQVIIIPLLCFFDYSCSRFSQPNTYWR